MKNANNLPHKSGIYKITNLINGKIYIGQAIDIYERYWNHHIYDYKREVCQHYQIYQAIRKYGLNNFSIEAIELCPIEQLNEREIYWVAFYDSYHKGYNMTEGGQNFSPKIFSIETEEKRAKTRELNQSLMNENHPRAKLTNEQVLEIRQRYIDGESPKIIYEDYKDLYESYPVFQKIILGIHYKTVGNIPTKKDKCLNQSKFSEIDIQTIRKLYYEDLKTQQFIADKYKVSQSTIKDIVNYKSYKEIPDNNFINNRQRKTYRLTPDEVREIRKKAADGIPVKKLVAEYCIDDSAIRNCIARKTYKNID